LVRSVQSIAGDGCNASLGDGGGKVPVVPSIQYLGGRTLCDEEWKSNASRISNTSENMWMGQSGGRIEPGLDIVTPKKQQSMQQ
jgi:hypothetical protein